MKAFHAIVAAAVVVGLQGAPAFADKLVVFKNGKALRVKSVKEEGIWLRCEFEDKNFIAIPRKGVASVEEAAAGSRDGDLRPNQVAAGSGGSYSGARGGGGAIPEPAVANEPAADQAEQANPDDLQSALAEEAAAVQSGNTWNGGVVVGGRRGGVARPGVGAPGVGAPGGTINQVNPFPNQQGRTGLRQRGTFNRGSVTQVPQNQVQGESQGNN